MSARSPFRDENLEELRIRLSSSFDEVPQTRPSPSLTDRFSSIFQRPEDDEKNEAPRIFSEGKSIITEEKHHHRLRGIFSFTHKKNLQRERWKKEIEMDEHIIPLEELVQRLGTDLKNGLSKQQVTELQSRYGPNSLPVLKQTSPIVKFLKYIFAPFNLLLMGGALLCFLSLALNPDNHTDLALGILLIFVVLIDSSFEFYQDAKSSRVMKGFANMIPQMCVVIRDGNKTTVPASELTIGDIVEIRGGDKVPADIRIIHSQGIKVDNSSLTGESEPQHRSTDCTNDNPLETRNLAFFTSLVLDGIGAGIVVNIGKETIIGKIAALASMEEAANVPLKKDISRFTKFASILAITVGVIFFGLGFISFPLSTNLVFAIGIIVSNVPAGLPPTVTLSLTLTAKKLAKKNVLAKNLSVVETLGSCTTICSDKTGTLTMNQMSVSHIWTNDKLHSSGIRSDDFQQFMQSPGFFAVQRIATLCNKATFDVTSEKPGAVVGGDASEAAMLRFFDQFRKMTEMREENPKIFEVPFNSDRKFQFSIHRQEDQFDPRLVLVMKGAPDRVISRCSTVLVSDENGNPKEVPYSEEWSDKFDKVYNELGGLGERVFAFAQCYLDPEKYDHHYPFDFVENKANFPFNDLCFVGLVSLIDPPRPEVPDAIRLCKSAGVKVLMVTGDHQITAASIAKQVGILSEERDPLTGRMKTIGAIVNGSQLNEMSSDELKKILSENNQVVFARTSPQQKLKIVEACQDIGEVVAVTGDGVNDSPALKKADIGIAMNSGSDVSKNAADVILLDDNFSSIVGGIKEGRLIFDNLKKSVAYTLTSKIPQSIPFLFFITIRIPLPITAILILFIDLVADLLPAVSYAYEPEESDIMKRGPRNIKKDRLISPNLAFYSFVTIGGLQVLSGFAMYLTVFLTRGYAWRDIFFTAPYWDDLKDITFRSGVHKTYSERIEDLAIAQSAYFLSILMMQSAILFVDKTRRLSLFRQSFKNLWMIIGFFEIYLVAGLVIYVPFFNQILGTRPVPGMYWIVPLPFMLYVLCFDEIRKFFIRKTTPGGKFQKVCGW